MCVSANECGRRFQAVEPGGGEVAVETEQLDQGRLGASYVGGGSLTVEIAQQLEQTAHERGVRVAAEMAAVCAHFADHPRQRHATPDAIGLGAFGVGQRRGFARTIHDGGEPFLRVVDDRVVGDELLLLVREGHGTKIGGRAAACKPPGGRFTRGMVNPFAISWLWRGFMGRSMTFALLFASCVLGWSLSHYVNMLLTRLGVHWLYALMLPAFGFMWLAKREDRVFPDETKRKLCARGLIGGSILVAILIAW